MVAVSPAWKTWARLRVRTAASRWILGHGDGSKTATEYRVPVLCEIEIDPRIRVGSPAVQID